MPRKATVDWLLEPDQPGVRYRTLTELLGRREDDPEVREARARLTTEGWGATTLADRSPEGWWASGASMYRPKYLATTWRLLLLSELGLTRREPAVRRSCELWMQRFPLRGGGVGGNSKGTGHHCLVGNMVRALVRFGYADDPKVRRSLEWLRETADPNGGWSCFGRGRNLDSWEGLSAFAAYPRRRWSPSMAACVERAAEFFLARELHRQGARYPPWYRFHFPVHYYYDVLVGLELLTRLGYGDDRRLRFGLDLLREKRRADGRWELDAVHPDVEGSMAAWYRQHASDRPVPLAVEAPGRPSKMVTLTALTVLARVEAQGGNAA